MLASPAFYHPIECAGRLSALVFATLSESSSPNFEPRVTQEEARLTCAAPPVFRSLCVARIPDDERGRREGQEDENSEDKRTAAGT